MAAKLTRLTNKIVIQLYLVATSCTICNSRSRRSVRKLLDTPSYNPIYDLLYTHVYHRQRGPDRTLAYGGGTVYIICFFNLILNGQQLSPESWWRLPKSTSSEAPKSSYLLSEFIRVYRYEGVTISFRNGRLDRELQIVQLSATRCSCIAIL